VNKSGAITAAISQPPYQNMALKDPGIHKVLDSVEVVGGPLTNGWVYSTTKFHDTNPKVFKAFVDGMKDAIDFVNNEKRAAAEIYLSMNKEKLTVDELVALLNEPNMLFSPAPQNLVKAAQYFNRNGIIKQNPTSWKEFFFALALVCSASCGTRQAGRPPYPQNTEPGQQPRNFPTDA
jgi:NitT/TauT family transport system substrate-binding protein